MNNLERMKKFHQAKWNEPIIYELSEPGERAVLVPGPCCDCVSTDEALATLPSAMVRRERANLPEIAQLQLVRHYNHLSQENIGVDGNIDIGQGTCTMKYNPKINDRLAGQPKVADMHPLQPDETAQGILEVFYKTGELFKEISGLDVFSMQPGGGSHGVLALASIVRAYWRDKGEEDKRDEIITTLFSHPADCAVPIVKGYKVELARFPGRYETVAEGEFAKFTKVETRAIAFEATWARYLRLTFTSAQNGKNYGSAAEIDILQDLKAKPLPDETKAIGTETLTVDGSDFPACRKDTVGAAWTVDLDGTWDKVKGHAGMLTGNTNAGPVTFRILADGKEIFSRVGMKPEDVRQLIDVDIPAGAKRLRFTLTGEAGSAPTDTGVWTELRLFRAGSAK